jgi:hypothetical protein
MARHMMCPNVSLLYKPLTIICEKDSWYVQFHTFHSWRLAPPFSLSSREVWVVYELEIELSVKAWWISRTVEKEPFIIFHASHFWKKQNICFHSGAQQTSITPRKKIEPLSPKLPLVLYYMYVRANTKTSMQRTPCFVLFFFRNRRSRWEELCKVSTLQDIL